MNSDDYRFSQDAHERDLQVIWECDSCHRQRTDYPGVNEGGQCDCGGSWHEAGDTYRGDTQ